jgi:hypothetical protein
MNVSLNNISKHGKKNKTMIKKSWHSFLIFLLAFFGVYPDFNRTFAQEPSVPAELEKSGGIFGSIKAPPGVDKWQEQVEQQGGSIGIFLFISQLIKLITVVAGIWTMFNFIFAGWTYITGSGDSSAGEKVSKRMTNSVVGLVIVALSYSIAALIGLLIFGEAGFFLNPSLQTIGD